MPRLQSLLANPIDFALLFGSPVPGYYSPQDTVEPVVRGLTVLVPIVVDAATDCGSVPAHVPAGASGTSSPIERAVASAIMGPRSGPYTMIRRRSS